MGTETEVKQEYLVLFKAITDTIEELEAVAVTFDERLKLLKQAQRDAEELYMSGGGDSAETETETE